MELLAEISSLTKKSIRDIKYSSGAMGISRDILFKDLSITMKIINYEGEMMNLLKIDERGTVVYVLRQTATSGIELTSTPGKTTTILGVYISDTGAIVDELGNVKSLDFGPRIGKFNLLNTPDALYVTPDQFWNEYNRPWLDNVIDRGDIIKLATEPVQKNLYRFNKATGSMELTGFGREYTYLLRHGYKYNPISKTMSR